MNNSCDIQLPPIPKDIIFPDELNRYLKKQIEHLIHENGMLKKHLEENESCASMSCTEVDELKKKLKEYEKINEKHQFTTSTSIASSKIVELSKKLREKNSELEMFKTKCSRLEKNIFELQESSRNFSEVEASEKKTNSLSEVDTEQIKKVQEKLNLTSLKMRELQNTNIQLKTELQLMNKYLQQETGETFEKISKNPSWRGRAQIICDLQKKNQDLREKIKYHQNKNDVDFSEGIDTKLNILKEANENLKTSVDEHKKKIQLLKGRCKMLETEQVMNKSKILSFTTQAEKDKNLIETLSTQITNHEEKLNENMRQKEKYIRSLQKDNELLRIELSKERTTIENLTRDLNKKIESNNSMKNERESQRAGSSYEKKTIGMVDEKLVSRLEDQRMKLVELTDMQASRISNERNAHAQTQRLLRIEKQKNAQLEHNATKMELDMNNIRSGGSYSTLSTSKSVMDKNKGRCININNLEYQLEEAKETIKALKTRLDIEQKERRTDLKEFAKILDSSNPL